MSGKLFTGDKNGIGKEYILDTEILIFKGNYLNGKKNLKGNEYDEYGNIKFEGEYINGYKIKGKGYNEEAEEEENIAPGRESEKNTKKKNELQMSKYGMDIGGRKRKQSAHDNNIKSSGDIMQGISSKDKLEEVANTIEGNQINI